MLVLSDIPKWVGYRQLVLHHKPDVVLLAGDVTSDGFAAFWSEALERIPAFRREKRELARKFGIEIQRHNFSKISTFEKWDQFSGCLSDLEGRYRDSPQFHAARIALHLEPFYDFLRFAGRRATVFVVKGDHDDDFPGDYDIDRINSMRGCTEISGRVAEEYGLRFLGLGFKETHYKRVLRDLVARFKGTVDVIVAHSEQSRLPILSEFQPRLIARGHFGYGKFLVNGVPSVFTGGGFHSVVRVHGSITITQYRRGFGKAGTWRPKRDDGFYCRPWFTGASEFERYPWLKPYSKTTSANHPGKPQPL